MAEAIRKDQQSQNRSIELDSSQNKSAVNTTTSVQGPQTNTRSVGKKHKIDSPISHVRNANNIFITIRKVFLFCILS